MKWGIIKQARQQLKRMEARGIFTDSGATYKAGEQAIRANAKMTKADKKAAMERLAQQYMKSGFNTVKNIQDSARKMSDTSQYHKMYIETLEKTGDIKQIAEYMDAWKHERDTMVSRHFKYDAVQFISEVVRGNNWSSDRFYEMNDYLMKSDVSQDKVNDFILEMEENIKQYGTVQRPESTTD